MEWNGIEAQCARCYRHFGHFLAFGFYSVGIPFLDTKLIKMCAPTQHSSLNILLVSAFKPQSSTKATPKMYANSSISKANSFYCLFQIGKCVSLSSHDLQRIDRLCVYFAFIYTPPKIPK